MIRVCHQIPEVTGQPFAFLFTFPCSKSRVLVASSGPVNSCRTHCAKVQEPSLAVVCNFVSTVGGQIFVDGANRGRLKAGGHRNEDSIRDCPSRNGNALPNE